EAQFNIGDFVAKRIINYINLGDTTQSVNLPNVQMPLLNEAHRLIHIHANVPGVLAQINQLFAKYEINVLWQTLKTNEQVGYLVTDVNKQFDKKLTNDLKTIDKTIKFRVLY
ncbi:MAG TPA: phosphoglycerate dehydrogenase, partial [Burkholderiales bacterium]|nr:phosphoglycerate dehydrogenase [Burkholderiales bacterium]